MCIYTYVYIYYMFKYKVLHWFQLSTVVKLGLLSPKSILSIFTALHRKEFYSFAEKKYECVLELLLPLTTTLLKSYLPLKFLPKFYFLFL